ncbi:MAG: tetratricopeptide repeat protein [Saprospiraceae bacterium]
MIQYQNRLIILPRLSRDILSDISNCIIDKDLSKAEIIIEIENEADGVKYTLFGICCQMSNEYSDARKQYLSAIEIGEDGALFFLAILYNNQEKYDEAEKYYLLAIEKGNVVALNNLAVMYDNQEKYEQAEKYYLLAIEKGDVGASFNLALMYENQEKYEEAEKYYLLAIEKGNVGALNNLALMYYFTNTNNSRALELISKANALEVSFEYIESEIIIEIWNGIFRDLENRVVSVIKEKKFNNLDELIIELMVQQQKNLVLSLFHHDEIGKNLQDRYMVLYYATLIINNHLEDNLLLRIPPELQSTIDDVIAKIKQRQKIYGYN